MTRMEFMQHVKDGRMLPAYLLLGEERLFQEELTTAARDKILSPGDQEFNLLRLDAAGTGPEHLLTNLETPPFFGSVRLVILDRFEDAPAGLDEAVLKSLGRMADGVHLLVTATKLDGRKKNHQELQKKILVVDCSRLKPADLPNWVKTRSTQMGLKLTPGQIKTLADRVGSDLLRLRTELEKLAIYAWKKGEITDEALNSLAPGEPEPDIFALMDAVAAHNPKIGLPRLAELLSAGEDPIKILATLSKQVRNITGAMAARDRGLSPRILAEPLGINPYVAEKSFSQANRFTPAELLKIHERLLMADYRMKTGQREPRLELELAVVEITTGK